MANPTYTFEQQTRAEIVGLKTLFCCFLQHYWKTVENPRTQARDLAAVFESAMKKSALKSKNAEAVEQLRDLVLTSGLEVIAESQRGLPPGE